jgi:hypothetical protein
MPIVEIEGIGNIEFPDDMPEVEINAAIEQSFNFAPRISEGKLPAGTLMPVPIAGPTDQPIMDGSIPAGFNPATGLPYSPDDWPDVLSKTAEQFLPRARASLMGMQGLAEEQRGLEVSGRPTDPSEMIADKILKMLGRDRPLMIDKETWEARQQAGEKIIEGAKPLYELGQIYSEEAQAKAPEVIPGSAKEFTSELGGTVADMTVPVLMGILTRRAGAIPATTVGVTGMTPQVAGQAALRDQELTPEMRQMRAGLDVLAEEIPEMIPMGFLVGKGRKAFSRIVGATVGEGVQEEITNVLQAAIDKGTIDPAMTWGEVLKSGLDPKTFMLGAAAGGGIAVATQPITSAQNRQMLKEAKAEFDQSWLNYLQENQQGGPLFKAETAVKKPEVEAALDRQATQQKATARQDIMAAFEGREQAETAQKATEEEQLADSGVRSRIMESLKAQDVERAYGGEKVAPRTTMEEAFRRTVEPIVPRETSVVPQEVKPEKPPQEQVSKISETLPPRLAIEPSPEGSLSEEETAIEQRYAEQLSADVDKAVASYNTLEGSQGGKIINTDIARELSPDYSASKESRGALSSAVHEPASALVKEIYRRKLAEPDPTGNNLVTFTAGGSGAGKSVGIKEVQQLMAQSQIIYDTNMNAFKSAKEKIDMALNAGKHVNIMYVARDPVTALTEGTLKRGQRMGRTVPLNEHIRTHRGSVETIKKLREHYANDPRVDILYIDNTRGKGEARISDEKLPDTINFDNIEQRLNEALDNAYAEGKISEAVYRGTQGRKAGIARGEGTRAEERAGIREQPQQERPQREVGREAAVDFRSETTPESEKWIETSREVQIPDPLKNIVPISFEHQYVGEVMGKASHDAEFIRLVKKNGRQYIDIPDPEQAHAIGQLIKNAIELGVPESMLRDTIRAFLVINGPNYGHGMHLGISSDYDNNSHVSVRYDLLREAHPDKRNDAAQFVATSVFIHEVHHSIDIRKGEDGFSVVSPLFEISLDLKEKKIDMGPVMRDLYRLYEENHLGLKSTLGYPFNWVDDLIVATEANSEDADGIKTFLKQEAFAQGGRIYYVVGATEIGRATLKRVAPDFMKFMQEVHDAVSQSDTVDARDAAVQKAFRSEPALLERVGVTREAAEYGREGTEQRDTDTRRPEAGRAGDIDTGISDNAPYAGREAPAKEAPRDVTGRTDRVPARELSAPEEHVGRATDRSLRRFSVSPPEDFHRAITDAKAKSRFGASVNVYPLDDYRGMKTYLTSDKSAGFAIKPDGDLVSVFSDGTQKGVAEILMPEAIQQGAKKLDAFDTVLPPLYSKYGFKAVARMKWNDEFAPAEWNKETFRAFSNGEPDVVFMVYEQGAPLYKPGDGKLVEDYDEAVRLQDETMRPLAKEAALDLTPPRRPPTTPPIPPSPNTPQRRSAMDIYDRKVGKPPKPYMEIFKEWTAGRRLEHEFLDSGIPFKLMVDKVAPDIGPQDNPYYGWKLLSGDSALIEDWLGINPGTQGGAPFRLGDRLKVNDYGKSLREILAPVAHDIETLKEFEAYLIGRRANELYGKEKEHLFTRSEIDELLALETPAFKAVAKEVYAYNDRLLQYAVDGGFLDPKVAEKFREYVNYIPFYREAQYEGDVGGPRKGSLYHRLKGGTQNLRSPLQNLIENTATVIHAVNRNAVLNNALDMTKAFPGAKAWMEQVQLPTQVLNLSTDRIVKQLVDQGVYVNRETADELAVMQTFFMKKPLGDEQNRIIVMKRNGKTIAVKIHDPMLWRTLHAFSPTELGLIVDILAVPAATLRTGVVFSPDFMSRNFLRDTLSAYIQSGKKFMPVADSLKGFVHVAHASETYRLYRAMGGAYADFWHGDSKEAAVSLRRLAKISRFPGSRLLNPAGWWRTLKKVGSITEAGSRTRTMEKYLDGTIEGALKGAIEAREVTVDFGMHGVNQSMRILERITPFLNPAKQGMYKMSRTFGNYPMTTLLRGAPIVLMTLALWMLNRDKDWYKDLEDWEKDMYWHFDIGMRSEKNKVVALRLPKPFEYGAVFGSFWEAGLEGMYNDNPDAMKRAFGTVENVFGLRLMPTVASVPLELRFNKSFFTERNIVPEGMETLEPYLQYGAGTSNVAKVIGQAFNASPYKIDYGIRNIFGTMGVYATSLMDHPLGNAMGYPEKPAITPRQWPLMKVFVSDPDRSGTRAVTEFYELLQEARTRYASWSYLQYDYDYMDKQAEKSGDLMYLKATAENAAHVMAGYRKANRDIRDDKTLTPEQKRILIDENGEQIKQIAKDYRDLLKGAKP